NIQYNVFCRIHYGGSIIGIETPPSASTSGEKDSSTPDYFVITSNRHIMPASKNGESWCWGHATLSMHFLYAPAHYLSPRWRKCNDSKWRGITCSCLYRPKPASPPSVLPCRRKLGWQPSHALPASPTKAWK